MVYRMIELLVPVLNGLFTDLMVYLAIKWFIIPFNALFASSGFIF
jgi:hypothetical protein